MSDGVIKPSTPEQLQEQNRFFGIQLSHNIPTFIFCSLGIFICYCASGLSQELIYNSGYVFTAFLTLCAKLTCVVWGIVVSHGTILYHRRASHRSHCILGFLTFLTMWASNESLRYLNYPTQNIFKSAKVIPVLLVSTIMHKKVYTMREYVSAVLLFFGLVVFTLVDMSIDMKFDFRGIFFICLALFADAYIGNYQQLMLQTFNCTTTEILTFTNFYSSIFSLISCILSNELKEAIKFLNNDWGLLGGMLGYSFFNVVGSYFILYMIVNFGVYICTFTTSLRKALTIALSFLLFTKPFSSIYIIGYLLVCISIYLNLQVQKEKQSKQKNQNNTKNKQIELTNISTTNELSDSSEKESLISKQINHNKSIDDKDHINNKDDTTMTNGTQHDNTHSSSHIMIINSDSTNKNNNNSFNPDDVSVTDQDMSRWLNEESTIEENN